MKTKYQEVLKQAYATILKESSSGFSLVTALESMGYDSSIPRPVQDKIRDIAKEMKELIMAYRERKIGISDLLDELYQENV